MYAFIKADNMMIITPGIRAKCPTWFGSNIQGTAPAHAIVNKKLHGAVTSSAGMPANAVDRLIAMA